jgi:hypothetical protein
LAPDPEVDPNFHCPPGYFFEGNHERQNGPARCTLMTCENHSSLPGCTEDGNTNSRQVPAPGGTQSCSFTVSDAPSLVPQGQFCSSNTCWASALTMMLSYRDHQSYSTDTVLKMLGPVYVDKYKNNQGLTQDEFIQITTRIGLTGQSGFLDLDEIKDMLQKYGPIMIVDAENSNNPSILHARVIIGVREDCTDSNLNDAELTILDPLNPNSGNPIGENFDITLSKFESSPWHIIIHL